MRTKKHIGVIGGGPSALFLLKKLLNADNTNLIIDIFEAKHQLGAGMPYSTTGANNEHITNVSGNEIPELPQPLLAWIKTLPPEVLAQFEIDLGHFDDYHTLPRLLFGQYLSAQFELLLRQARDKGIEVNICLNTAVNDIKYLPDEDQAAVETIQGTHLYDHVVIATGHRWPLTNEGKVTNYFDSPYPPAKLCMKADHPVGLKGASLTAVDALQTLARANGEFIVKDDELIYQLNEDSPNFRLIMHSIEGLLPALRFHLADPQLEDVELTDEEVARYRTENDGFLPLDLLFEHKFKDILKQKDPEFYGRIKDMDVETFTETILTERKQPDPVDLLKKEYDEAELSIRERKPVYWKEILGSFSAAVSHFAKHFSAEDMQRYHDTLMPLIGIIIAYMPQRSAQEVMALHNAGVLELMAVDRDSKITPSPQGGAVYHYTSNRQRYFKTYVDCSGQRHFSFEDLPFKGLIAQKAIAPAQLKFRSKVAAEKAGINGDPNVLQGPDGNWYLQVPGVAINDDYQVLSPQRVANPRISIMAMPYIGGLDPDHSGLDHCIQAAEHIAKRLAGN